MLNWRNNLSRVGCFLLNQDSFVLPAGTYFYVSVFSVFGCPLYTAPRVVLCQMLSADSCDPAIAFYFKGDFIVRRLSSLSSNVEFEGIYGGDQFKSESVATIAKSDVEKGRLKLNDVQYVYSHKGAVFFGPFATPEVCVQFVKETLVSGFDGDSVYVGALGSKAADSAAKADFSMLGYFRGQLDRVMKLSLSTYREID